jgi:heme exporter protein CcmD
MIDLGQHAEYIVWGYLGVMVVSAALIAWVRWDSRRVGQKLKALEAQGIRRRSAGSPNP